MSAGELGVTSRMCHTWSTMESGLHCKVRPSVGEGVGTGTSMVAVRWPYRHLLIPLSSTYWVYFYSRPSRYTSLEKG